MRIFAEFKEFCHLHTRPYDPRLAGYYKRMVALQRKNNLLKQLQDDSGVKELREELEKQAASRVFDVKNVPPYIRKKLIAICNDVVSKYKPNTIDLVGSYCNGKYIDEQTPQEFVELRTKAYKFNGLSDFDIMTDACITEGKKILGELKYDMVCLGSQYNHEYPPLRIYENGKILL